MVDSGVGFDQDMIALLSLESAGIDVIPEARIMQWVTDHSHYLKLQGLKISEALEVIKNNPAFTDLYAKMKGLYEKNKEKITTVIKDKRQYAAPVAVFSI